MGLLYTVENLITEVRDQLDELNSDSVSDSKILNTINRAQDFAFDIYARLYPEPILAQAPLTIPGGVQEVAIPEGVFEDRVLKIEMRIPTGGIGSTYAEVQQIAYSDLTDYESASNTNIPLYFAIYGRTIRFAAPVTGTYPARIWFLRNPEKLVTPQGRITRINNTSNYVIVDSAGSSLTTESDKLQSYVNIVDGQTGEIRGSLQIQALPGNNKLAFRTVPARSDVLNRDIGGSLEDLEISLDDYVSPIDGTCVPYYGKPTCNFIIQFAVAEITRSLGGQADTEEQVLKKFEQQVERSFAGRQQTRRVKKRSYVWGVPVRRWYWS